MLRLNGHFAGGEALQGPRNAATLRWKDGKMSITDGPYAETKEQLGGILILEARDLNHAIQLMSKDSGVKASPLRDSPGRRPGRNDSRFAKASSGGPAQTSQSSSSAGNSMDTTANRQPHASSSLYQLAGSERVADLKKCVADVLCVPFRSSVG